MTGALGSAEGARTPFVSVVALFFAVENDVPFTLAAVSAALSVVINSLVRVHVCLLLLTLDISKGAVESASLKLLSAVAWGTTRRIGLERLRARAHLQGR